MGYTAQQLEECMKNAYSYENREKHGAAGFQTTYIGTVQRGRRLYDLYIDTNQSYWFKNRIITDRGVVSEYESIFGHPERRAKRG
mgnify:CR=1 FL=1|jgi:hypothetical protein